MNCYPIILTLLVSAATLLTCSCNDNRAAHTNIITEWVGREIVIPDELVYQIKDDTIDLDLSRPDFKIISYVDSTGCTSCRMKLRQWSELINELKSLPDVDVEIIMIINTDTPKEITYLLQRDNYLNPVAIDRDNLFDRLNELPPKSEHHTFLLDAENKVLAIGNPVLNPKIKQIFRQHLTSNIEAEQPNGIIIRPAKALGVVLQEDSVTKTFYLNAGDSTEYTVESLVPSCDCVTTTVVSNADIGTINVSITYTAESEPGTFKRYVDVFFNEKDNPERLTVYGYVK